MRLGLDAVISARRRAAAQESVDPEAITFAVKK
jgi:hypothetical protein